MMHSLRGRRILQSFVCISGLGLLLSSCSATVALSTQSQHLNREVAACERIGTPPKLPSSTPDSFIAISIKTSLISALADSDNASLENVAQDLRSAARTQTQTGNVAGIVRALDKGVTACHHLGLSTAK